MSEDCRRRTAPIVPRPGVVTAVVRALDDAGVAVDDVEVHGRSPDDVSFTLTGRPSASADGATPELEEVA